MSEVAHKADTKAAHGSILSYVIGFVLSLAFTINAYSAVVNKSFTGTKLLITILVFAVLQMMVQIFFFLHLGRGPKPMYNVVFFVATIGLILVVVIGSIFIMNNLHYNMGPTNVVQKLAQDESIGQVDGKKTGACTAIGKNYQITISESQVRPVHTEAKLCDTISFINQDEGSRNIVFGNTQQEEKYADQAVNIKPRYPKTITLNRSGDFTFHDKAEPDVVGDFRVTP